VQASGGANGNGDADGDAAPPRKKQATEAASGRPTFSAVDPTPVEAPTAAQPVPTPEAAATTQEGPLSSQSEAGAPDLDLTQPAPDQDQVAEPHARIDTDAKAAVARLTTAHNGLVSTPTVHEIGADGALSPFLSRGCSSNVSHPSAHRTVGGIIFFGECDPYCAL
jgi:hypothetical protein